MILDIPGPPRTTPILMRDEERVLDSETDHDD
jgi:hypothetical protein